MKTLALAASAALFAFPGHAGDMWMLRATLCLKTGASNAECRRETRGPFADPKECRVRAKIVGAAAQEQAEAIRAELIFFAAECARSNRDM